jgi:hypothetical protein
MKKINSFKICIIIFFLLAELTVIPANYASAQDIVSHNIIQTELLDGTEKKTKISLPNSEIAEIKSILLSLENNLSSASTYQQAEKYISGALCELHLYGIFGNIDISYIKNLCMRQSRIMNNIESLSMIHILRENNGGDNAFCLLLSHIHGYVYDHGIITFLAILIALSALPFIIIFYPVGVIFNILSEAVFSFQHKKPFIPPFPHRVETRYNESYSNLISRGLYGIVHNDYTNWGFRFDAFMGVRINIMRDESLRINESYYLGSALFVSWQYDGP